MGSLWATEDILITVRAAPNPSKKYTETSCVAGVRLRDMKPVRIYPVPARQLSQKNRFTKYSVIRAELQKSNDTRHESFKVNFKTIREVDKIDTGPGSPPTWQRRSKLIEPFRIAESIEGLKKLQDELGIRDAPSLAIIRPKRIKRFRIDPTEETD